MSPRWAIVYNALIIPTVMPLALRGARYRPLVADALLHRNRAICVVGGRVAAFVRIRLIDLLLHGVLDA